MAFKDVRIVGVDREGSIQMENGAAKVRFLLSAEPPPEWIRIFMDEIRGAEHAVVGEVIVLGDEMVTESRIAHLQRHVDELKLYVSSANAIYARRFPPSAQDRDALDAALSSLRL
jgi:hypothetical protein